MAIKQAFKQAFESFITEAFQKAVDQSTRASWSGGRYYVELLVDGSYRVLWSNQIGNRYDSPGVIIPIPALTDDEWDEDPAIRFYDGAEEEIRDTFEEIKLKRLISLKSAN